MQHLSGDRNLDVFSVKSLPATIAIMLNLPLALIGGILSTLLTGGVISVASLTGLFTLFGVAVRNGLLLVDNFNRKFAQNLPIQKVILESSQERANAIMMTALIFLRGMLPLAIANGASNEISQPSAIVVLGGWSRQQCSRYWSFQLYIASLGEVFCLKTLGEVLRLNFQAAKG